ncbi:MAG: 3-mercaptopyruvate sulfurtransferase [Alphaproteobacteria bacterium]|nr:3-mercaptopyruvate sulfurtransferase [Alphaproteobacteria bacterium]
MSAAGGSGPGSVVEVSWLAEHLSDADLRIVDASWFLPTDHRDAQAEYRAAHIPGAVFFNIDAIADTKSGLPHMLPAPAVFAASVGALGIGDGDRVVVYDQPGLYSAARVWWSLRTMGLDRVSVLAGGLRQWRSEGRPLASGEETPPTRHFTPHFRPDLVRDRAQVLSALQRGNSQIIDARAPGRFAATEPEPRPGVRGGHIPGARNLHFASLVDQIRGRLRPAAELQAAFTDAGIRPEAPTTLLCGSGITACILGLALDQLGHARWSVYDGSWADWGAHHELPITH